MSLVAKKKVRVTRVEGNYTLTTRDNDSNRIPNTVTIYADGRDLEVNWTQKYDEQVKPAVGDWYTINVEQED